MSEGLEAFLSRVEFEPNTGCWLWSGAPGAGGYGVIWFGGRYQKAHRVSWALHHGEMPPRHVKVCHRCDTPACVNPAHLWLGTQAENIADMVAKGRQRTVPRFGSANPRAALTEDDVWAIRHMLRWRRWSQGAIARSYGVSVMTLSRIANHQTWPHVHSNWPYAPLPIHHPEPTQ
jgi:hypothetical protein